MGPLFADSRMQGTKEEIKRGEEKDSFFYSTFDVSTPNRKWVDPIPHQPNRK